MGKARHAYVSRVDGDHGDPRPAYEKMGSPVYPTQAQLQKLREVSLAVPPEVLSLNQGELTLSLPTHGLAVVTIKK
jgi:xylan 1,4-beta-xylosidase